MISSINSSLKGEAMRLFRVTVDELIVIQDKKVEVDKKIKNTLVEIEKNKIIKIENSFEELIATIQILYDLLNIGWKIKKNRHVYQLISPEKKQIKTTSEIKLDKENNREKIKPLLEQQMMDDSVRLFINKIESGNDKNKVKSISELICNGSELIDRLNNMGSHGISPYLQLVEAKKVDDFTGIRLSDIWRYFRYTWSLPQNPTPGRQLRYLVRDASHPIHPIIGILGFNNCALQMGNLRESFLGWSFNSYFERIKNILSKKDVQKNLKKEINWIEKNLNEALSVIAIEGIVNSIDEIKNPSTETLNLLNEKINYFDSQRKKFLEYYELNKKSDSIPVDSDKKLNLPPLSEEIRNLDGSKNENKFLIIAKKCLIARKRAIGLKENIEARFIFNEIKDDFVDLNNIKNVLDTDKFKKLIGIITKHIKNKFAGTNILEISTCGAIEPYNHLLGGKLVSLLSLSAQIASDWKKLYSTPSIIASQTKNDFVIKENHLVYLTTTSLYGSGASQYNRVKLPKNIISKDQNDLNYINIGKTSGFGTLQFPIKTQIAIEKFILKNENFKNVNSIFGEGPSPKLRKINQAMSSLGFNPDHLMRHNQERIIYAIPLCEEFNEYLQNRKCNLPDYIIHPDKYIKGTFFITNFWKQRWLTMRLRPDVLQKVQNFSGYVMSDKYKVLK